MRGKEFPLFLQCKITIFVRVEGLFLNKQNQSVSYQKVVRIFFVVFFAFSKINITFAVG